MRSLAVSVWGWIMRRHMAVAATDVGLSVCLNHRRPTPWPCDKFLRADRAIDRLINKTHERI